MNMTPPFGILGVPDPIVNFLLVDVVVYIYLSRLRVGNAVPNSD